MMRIGAVIESGRSYSAEEAAQVIDVTTEELRRWLAEAGHDKESLTAARVEEAWKSLKPWVVAAAPAESGRRVTGQDEAALRRLWEAHGATRTPTSVQFRFATEAEAVAFADSLSPYPAFLYTPVRVAPGQSGCQAYAAQVAGRMGADPED